MFNNIGNKVKGLAIFVFAIGVIASFAGTAALLITFAAKLSPLIVLLGAAVFAAGCLGAWVCSWVIYCIGDTNVKTTEAQEQLEELQEQIRRLSGKSPAKPKKDAAPEKKPAQQAHRPAPESKPAADPPQAPQTQQPDAENGTQIGKCSICGFEQVPVRKQTLHNGMPGTVCEICYREFFSYDSDADE